MDSIRFSSNFPWLTWVIWHTRKSFIVCLFNTHLVVAYTPSISIMLYLIFSPLSLSYAQHSLTHSFSYSLSRLRTKCIVRLWLLFAHCVGFSPPNCPSVDSFLWIFSEENHQWSPKLHPPIERCDSISWGTNLEATGTKAYIILYHYHSNTQLWYWWAVDTHALFRLKV